MLSLINFLKAAFVGACYVAATLAALGLTLGALGALVGWLFNRSVASFPDYVFLGACSLIPIFIGVVALVFLAFIGNCFICSNRNG